MNPVFEPKKASESMCGIEMWVEISGSNGKYFISNLGNLYSTKHKRILQGGYNLMGYKIVGLTHMGPQKMFLVHRLVAAEFVENPLKENTVNHINAIKTDNRACNLEWCNMKHNMQHAAKLGLMTGPVGRRWKCRLDRKIRTKESFNGGRPPGFMPSLETREKMKVSQLRRRAREKQLQNQDC